MSQSKGPLPKAKKPTDRKHVNLFGYYCDAHVCHPEEMPKGPHWAALLFKTFGYTEAGWGRDDPSTAGSFDHTEYYVFHDEDDLKHFIQLYNEEKAKSGSGLRGMTFFKVAGIGKAEIQVSVKVDVSL